jgi:outer membrane protein insertion porin family
MTSEPTAEVQHPHHRPARERQRRGPMWGCMKWVGCGGGGLLALILLVIGGGWWWLGTTSFADLVRLRIEKTMEARLGRDVSIGSVTIQRGRLSRIIINDVRIANVPNGKRRHFATVKQIIITGGIDSFWGRKIRVGRVDLIEPRMSFEVFKPGERFAHNFPHWQSGPKSRYEIYHLDLGTMQIANGTFEFVDHRHDITTIARRITSTINITSKEDLYAGVMNSPAMDVRIQDYVPFKAGLRAQFRYTPNVLDLQSVALEGGPDLRVFVNGRVAPLADAVYNLRLRGQVGLNRVRDIFKIQKTLDGSLVLDTNLRGKEGDFVMTGAWAAPKIRADVYELANARGTLNVTDQRILVDIQRAQYGGGTIGAHYQLTQYAEPYPMSVDLRYNGVSIEKLFDDWGIKDTGLRGGATGRLAYSWNKDRVLAGAGEGTATLAKSTTGPERSEGSNAKYPIPVGGSTDFALDNGVVTFHRLQLNTDASQISATGKLRIEDAWTDLLLQIHSSDFAELDRVGFNLAHSAGKKTYTLLGLGGSGDISGNIKGKIKSPEVTAKIAAAGVKYNNVLLGDSDIDLRYDGGKSELIFDRAIFREGAARLSMTGTIAFPDKGPSPRFDLAMDAVDYPVDRAIAIVNLKLVAHGIGTGHLVVTGTPEEGKLTFAGMTVHEAKGDLRLNGTVAWHPGKGNVGFDLDIAANNYPVANIVAFLDLGKLPVSGELTGTLHLAGPKSKLEGAGTVTVRNGAIYGEPVTSATANIQFTQGVLKATNVTVVAPAGTVTGEAQINFENNQFSYTIASSNLDLSKVKLLSSLAGILGGNVTLSSTGAGTLTQPEMVLTATLNQATIQGLNLPPNTAPPQLYIAIRGGRLIVRGSIGDLVTVEGDGGVAADGTLSGLVRLRIPDVARALALSPKTADMPASGAIVADLRLGGTLASLESVRIDATFPQFDVRVGDHDFHPARPLRASLRDGRIVFDDFQLALGDTATTFGVAGYVELSGAKRINLDLRGTLEAALLQFFMPTVRADGHIVVAGGIRGTLAAPALVGSAEFQHADVRNLPGFTQAITDITGTVVFREDRIDIDSLRAKVGGGTVVAGGSVTMEGLTPKRARVTLQGTEVAFRYFEGVTIEGNFTLLVSGDMERFVVSGDVDVTRALYFRDVDIGTALLNAVLARRGPTPVVAAGWQGKVGLRIHLAAPGTLAVRNNLADLTGSADLDVTGTLAQPSIIGNVTLNEGGTVRLQKIDYRVTRGTINFQNPFRIDPYLDVTLEARVSGGLSEIESGPIDVTVTITGTLDRITPTITSDPPASDITLFSLLGLGTLAGAGGTTNTTTTNGSPFSTLGNSLLSQTIGLLGSRVLPFADAFTFDPGNIDKSGDPGPKVSIAKRLSNTLNAFVIYNTKDGHNRIVLEWQVNPDWVLQFNRDELSQVYTIEARFRRRYEGHWVWGTHGRTELANFASVAPAGAAVPQPLREPTTAVTPANGAKVVAVALHSDARIDTATLMRYVTVKQGQPLSVRAVQNSIKSLFATGDFRDIRVNADPAAGGVNVTFVLFTNFRVTAISFDGLGGADKERATREVTFHLGDVLSLNAVDHSATAVQELLTHGGYLEAAVDPETTFERGQGQAKVVFHVARGPRAHVRTVNLAGNIAPFKPQELVDRMKRGPGKGFNLAEARLDADRMQTWLVRRNYRKADIRYQKYSYDPATHTVALEYTATVGPIVQVEVTGQTKRQLRGLLPFKKNESYTEDVIDKASNDIVDHLQAQGFYKATVDVDEALHDNVWTITFHVNPGEHFSLETVTFTGNQKLSDKELADVVQTAKPGHIRSFFAWIFRRPTGGMTRAELSADRDAIEAYYKLHGFSQAAVANAVVNANAATHAMSVDFPITEGPQTLVSQVNIEGIQQVDPKELPKPTLKTGQPLNPQVEQNDVLALQTFYADRGNAEVQVRPREEVSADKTAATVTYTVAEGPKVSVGDVVVRGNTYTNSSVVSRTSQLEKGEPFNFLKILEAQRNLYRLGIFQRVDVQPEQAGTSVADRNVTISVQEGKDLTVAGSVGATSPMSSAQGVRPLGSVSIAHRNLFGTARYLGFEYIWANPRKEAFLTYREPYVGPFDIPLQITAFQSTREIRDNTLQSRGAFIEATRVAAYQTRWSVRYEYRISQCKKGPLCDFADLALFPGIDRSVTNVRISSLTPTFFWDKRDDVVDPHRGFFTNASVEYAFRALAAEANFLKEFAQASYFLPVSERSVFAVSGRVGLIQDLGKGIDPDTGKLLSGVPVSERFTGGGESSHRAFPLDLLGITCADPRDADICQFDASGKPINATLLNVPDDNFPDTDPRKRATQFPTGGRSIFIVNAEYRFPIAGPFGGTVFVDAGNVYPDTRILLDKLRYGVGGGARYLSPVGPVRLDVGYNLRRHILYINPEGKAFYEKPLSFFLTLGYAF